MKTTSRILSIGVALLLLISLCALPVFADDTSTNPPVTTSADGVYVTAATVTDIAGGEVTTVDEDALLGDELVCPNCGASFGVELAEDEEDDSAALPKDREIPIE